MIAQWETLFHNASNLGLSLRSSDDAAFDFILFRDFKIRYQIMLDVQQKVVWM